VPAEHQVVEHGEAAEECDVLKRARDTEGCDLTRPERRDLLPFKDDAPRIRPVEARDHVEERRLAGTVRPNYGKNAPARHLDRHVLHRRDAAELLRDARDGELWRAHWRSRCRTSWCTRRELP